MDNSIAVRTEHNQEHQHTCRDCGDDVDYRRWALGYKFCLDCGNTLALQRKHTIVPMNKSNYMLVTDYDLLKQLNPKRTT